ncbi:Hypothetical predicted protein [Olea europaea subsp. europaea]|uniref:Uncharacterized protein n=1 Tax=Olea europaea subsp. europaea TaxID=158383 RepID=A0A8S0REE3_OLEEU|nr:Hypothetical predicted protein [Olea europaea subsp. europaea]
MSLDLINCANLHRQRLDLGTTPCKQNSNVGTVTGGGGVKEKGINLMGFVGRLSPGTIQDINGSPYIYTPQCLRVLDQSFHGSEVVVYKPEPLSIIHEANCSSAKGGGDEGGFRWW